MCKVHSSGNIYLTVMLTLERYITNWKIVRRRVSSLRLIHSQPIDDQLSQSQLRNTLPQPNMQTSSSRLRGGFPLVVKIYRIFSSPICVCFCEIRSCSKYIIGSRWVIPTQIPNTVTNEIIIKWFYGEPLMIGEQWMRWYCYVNWYWLQYIRNLLN